MSFIQRINQDITSAMKNKEAERLSTLSTLEINPLIVNRTGVVGVDVLGETHEAPVRVDCA